MNRLAGAASLYLRQHADNPVDWWPWSDEAFDAARARDVPVFLSIGYAACHWCHVMAHECFENPTIAALMNEYTVAIKVDREERPDVDALYMSATQAMTGRGGWPMSVFLTPNGAPFFAGTYFPPTPRHGQPSFAQVITSVADVWANRRQDLLEQAERLTSAIAAEANLPDTLVATGPPRAGRVRLDALVGRLAATFDPSHGGFSAAPKFPHPAWIEACLAHSWATGHPEGTAMATTTLDAMARGGLFDHVGGGFARYSVDAEWHVPHFEKMLSDQALLARAYARAAAWGGDASTYAAVARRTLDFVLDELRVADGFASSLDADAGGNEGAHVVLTPAEVRDELAHAGVGALAARTIERYRLTDDGPVDGACVPRLAPGTSFAGDSDDERVRAALLARREHLAHPGIDDKVLLEWNAMLASVLAEAAWRLDEPRFGLEARSLVDSLSRTHRGDGHWLRRSGPLAPLATCGDVAWLLDARVSLYELDGEPSHLEAATALVDDLLDGYWDGARPTTAHPDAGRGLFQSHRDQTGLLMRAKDVLDGAVPSGTSVAAVALARLAALTGDASVLVVAERLVALGQPLLDAQPQSAATLIEAACRLDEGMELVVPGEASAVLAEVRRHGPPWSVLAFGTAHSPLFEDRRPGVLYVCRASVCEAPLGDVASVAAALATAARGEASQ